jgi:FKBP-type peptidyl-prolyl cis-trans isomerase FkpA
MNLNINKKKLMQRKVNKITLHQNKYIQMKKWFFLCAVSALGFSACNKSDNASTDCTQLAPETIATATEKAYLQTYFAANGITNAVEKNGMYYVITTQGTGISPNLCSYITIDYVGKIMLTTTDGTQFDASQPGQPYSSQLFNLITGWKLILPLIKSGGTATLYIPPSMGYGAAGQGSIPGNAYLKFQITLRAVQ